MPLYVLCILFFQLLLHSGHYSPWIFLYKWKVPKEMCCRFVEVFQFSALTQIIYWSTKSRVLVACAISLHSVQISPVMISRKMCKN